MFSFVNLLKRLNIFQEELEELLALSCLTQRISAKNFTSGESFLYKNEDYRKDP
jgi:hypothetical protein